MRSSASASNARIHSQSESPNALVVFARTSGYSLPITPCSRSISPRSSGGSRYQSIVRTYGYTQAYFPGGVPFTNAGAWSGLNSAGLTTPMNDQVISSFRPSAVRRNSTNRSWRSSAECPTHHNMRSASGRNPTVE